MQPFRGGVSFVVRQAVGWTVYAVALLAATVLVVTSGNELPIYGAYSATGIVGLVGMVVLMLSISFFEDSYVHNPPLRLQVRACLHLPVSVLPPLPSSVRPPARPYVRTSVRTPAMHPCAGLLPLSLSSLSLSLCTHHPRAPRSPPCLTRTDCAHTHTYIHISGIIHHNIPIIVRSPDHPS